MRHSKNCFIVVIVFLFSLFINNAFAITTSYCSKDSSIVINPYPFPNPNTPRSSAIVPISASYESLLTSVILYFSHDLGEIEVEVLNTYTGGYDSGIVDTQYLSVIIPITLGNGHYIITFTLPSGQRFRGEFDV